MFFFSPQSCRKVWSSVSKVLRHLSSHMIGLWFHWRGVSCTYSHCMLTACVVSAISTLRRQLPVCWLRVYVLYNHFLLVRSGFVMPGAVLLKLSLLCVFCTNFIYGHHKWFSNHCITIYCRLVSVRKITCFLDPGWATHCCSDSQRRSRARCLHWRRNRMLLSLTSQPRRNDWTH